jgi:hypothetical protein
MEIARSLGSLPMRSRIRRASSGAARASPVSRSMSSALRLREPLGGRPRVAGMTQQELTRRAGVRLSTVRDFESRERTPIANNLAAIRRAIEAAGIQLLFDENQRSTGMACYKPLGLLS